MELVPNTGMAVIFDVGDEHDIHPRNKKTVGSRLARLALSQTYGHDLMGAAPFPVAAAILPEGVCSIQFEEVRSDLLPVNALLELGGFELAGDDGIFVAASAAVSGNTVLVTWTQASVPSQVRYCWMDDPAGVNRLQVEGLPVSPFHLQITGLPAEGPVDPK